MPRINLEVTVENSSLLNSAVITALSHLNTDVNWNSERDRARNDATRTANGVVQLNGSDDERYFADLERLNTLLNNPTVSINVPREQFQRLTEHAFQRLQLLRRLEAAIYERTVANV